MKIAIVTDSMAAFGGSDRYLLSLLKAFPESELYTSIYDPDIYTTCNLPKVHSSFIQNLPFNKFWKRHYTVISPMAFEMFDFSKYDLVISCSAGCSKGVITSPDTLHVGIVFTPPRYQWGGDPNTKRVKFRSIYSFFMPLVDHYLRIWDFEAAKRPDFLVSISKYVESRVEKYYKRDSSVIYPGINTDFWKPIIQHDKENQTCKGKEDFFVIVSRLFEYKRIDLAIQACNKLNKRLVIIGTGPDENYLRSIAGENVSFLGFLDDELVRDYFRRAKGFLFCGLDDFGLTPVEAMACGTPVIAYNKGGATESVVDEVSGILFNNQTVEDVVGAIKNFETIKFNSQEIISRAHVFSEKVFIKNIRNYIYGKLKKNK
ncbi:glycosyltransferase [Candidatus Dojkabacteria bacterium]|nr:glycosyltransferase [Candidatus Dojkabacteria bacterium]